jgi:RNA polymerase sigma-70 factor, ECF subfamily
MGDLVTSGAVQSAAAPGSEQLDARLEQHRVELTGYCYRMLGSGSEAEDAVQETLVRAWRAYDRFEGRSSLRSWLYRIATNVCLDMLNGPQRRARPMDLGPASPASAPLGAPLPERTWVGPVPDRRVLPGDDDPADLAASRDTIRLAFVAALQHLPPRQRAVLILREVLRWKASEVAELLDTSVASVNSALQRARATLASSDLSSAADQSPALGDEQAALLARYVDAFERYDIDALVSLVHEDATFSMPPFALWLQGPTDIAEFYLGTGAGCRGSRLVPVMANGTPAFGHYKPSGTDGGYEPWALQVIETSAAGIVGIHNFLDTAQLFPLFGLPPRLEG